ncbi:MAG: FUSC family protein [Streptomyces sp.]|uniref:FUSC family protein n=1 Tax=Streptomyces sp. TaxID=1931 RepID=UPI003D6C58A1
MTETAAPPQRTHLAPQGRQARVRQWLSRAKGSDGHERHTVAFIGKATLAVSVSWLIAHEGMAAESPAFAPFSALLIIQVTVYQSLLQALRYVGAVSAGVALQAVLGFLTGSGPVTFTLVALIALVIGRWRRLGTQGSQVATASFFAFSTYLAATSTTQQLNQLGQIILLVFLGCGVGVAVNMLVLPPLRYRSAEHGVHVLAHSLCDLISDIYPALWEAELKRERTRHWRHRAAHLGDIVAQAHASVRTAWESTFYNPLHLLRRRRGRTTFSGYQTIIDALERVTYQVASMTRSLDQWHTGGGSLQQRDFLRGCGDLLASLASITQLMSRIDEDHLTEQYIELCSLTEQAQHHRNRLAQHTEESSLPVADPTMPYGILLAEATRLMDEFQHTCEVIHQVINRADARPATA